MRAVEKRAKSQLSIRAICKHNRLNRDAYYKIKSRSNKRLEVESKVIEMVNSIRNTQPRVGTRKLHHELRDTFDSLGFNVGRDRLFNILKSRKMLIQRKKVSYKTTNSHHRFHKYKNLIKDMEINAPNQVWVTDITYIRTIKGFCYLALITDLYSRKIVGSDLSDSLELTGCLRALKMALAKAKPKGNLVHHSDRGIQYCSNQYVKQLNKHNIQISMTEENHCYENAVAERVNGILKGEFYLDECFTNTRNAKKAAKCAIDIYNNKRLHLSLNFKTPNTVYNNLSKN
jgi:transposase InsO family protein